MSKTHRIRLIYTAGTTQVGDKSLDYTSDSETNLSVVVPINGATTISYAATTLGIKALFISTDRTINVCTNAAFGSSPTDTIAVTANIPFIWSADIGTVNPFANGNVTSLHVTLPNSGSPANLSLYSVSDVTP